jgi:menaquinone-dependent protoporphyrinogen oxidase
MKVLVGYATKHGSTAEVAQFIGNIFREHHLDATVMAVEQVQSVTDYDAFVLGSPVYASMWLTEMSQFLERFGNELAKKPVYYWMNCIRVLEEDGLTASLNEYVHKPTMEKLGVRDIGVFAGKLDLNEIDWNERWTLAARYEGDVLPASRSGDFRDWNTIREWAARVRDELTGE